MESGCHVFVLVLIHKCTDERGSVFFGAGQEHLRKQYLVPSVGLVHPDSCAGNTVSRFFTAHSELAD